MQISPSMKVQNSSSGHGGIYVELHNAGKRFNRDWIFRRFTHIFKPGTSYAITGPNGSGKSTLLQCIAASTQLSEGSIQYKTATALYSTEDIFRHAAIVAPYLEVIEEMTAIEFLTFHTSFKPLVPSVLIKDIPEIIGIPGAAQKQIRFYSSGMKQRIKLAQAFFSDVPLLLLDEPCTNLDASGYRLYHQLIQDYCSNKTVIVSSNDINEYDFCPERLNIIDFK